MYRPRIIPVLLLKDQALVKTIKFKKHRYIGDAINDVKIFNELQADELVFLDISASSQRRLIDLEFVKQVSEEANMPFSVGGGIKSSDDIRAIISAGAEKVIIGTQALENPNFIRLASQEYGTSTISVCIDFKKNFLGKNRVWAINGTRSYSYSPHDFACKMEELGAGEIIIQSIERDGSMKGYDLEITHQIVQSVSIPVVALGGAGSIDDLRKLNSSTTINGIAAGSLFVYQGPHKGVLINYPENKRELLH